MKRETDSSGKPLVWGAVVLVLLGAGLLVALWPRARSARTSGAHPVPSAERIIVAVAAGEHGPPAAAPSLARPKAESRLQASAEPPLPPLDLFASPGPEIIDVPHRIVAGGGTVNLMKLKEVYQFAKDHPGDARPHLIMAEDAINRGWYEQGIDHYVRAAKEDSRARQDEHMLRDLIKAAGREPSAIAAGDAIAGIYGRAALEGVRAAVDQATAEDDDGRMTRLSDLLVRLEGEPGSGSSRK